MEHAVALRRELCARNLAFAKPKRLDHVLSCGEMPVIVYCPEAAGTRHGNFFDPSYAAMLKRPDWARRLEKIHPQGRRALPRANRVWRELDSGTLLVEAKLTEGDFQAKSRCFLESYRDFRTVFEVSALPRSGEQYISYQLIRNVLAAYAAGLSFCVIIDTRRQDLVEAWYAIVRCVRMMELRTRCKVLTWQELSSALPVKLQKFLEAKYGIVAKAANQLWLARGVRNVVVTLGAQGALVKNVKLRESRCRLRCHPVVETTGAGDAFNAGFAVGLAEGMDIVAATRFGCAVAGISATRLGTAPSMPRRSEVEALLKRGG